MDILGSLDGRENGGFYPGVFRQIFCALFPGCVSLVYASMNCPCYSVSLQISRKQLEAATAYGAASGQRCLKQRGIRQGVRSSPYPPVSTRNGRRNYRQRNKTPPAGPGEFYFLAQREGFEPSCGCPQTDFESLEAGVFWSILSASLRLSERRKPLILLGFPAFSLSAQGFGNFSRQSRFSGKM